jgi:hypothetical protein
MKPYDTFIVKCFLAKFRTEMHELSQDVALWRQDMDNACVMLADLIVAGSQRLDQHHNRRINALWQQNAELTETVQQFKGMSLYNCCTT